MRSRVAFAVLWFLASCGGDDAKPASEPVADALGGEVGMGPADVAQVPPDVEAELAEADLGGSADLAPDIAAVPDMAADDIAADVAAIDVPPDAPPWNYEKIATVTVPGAPLPVPVPPDAKAGPFGEGVWVLPNGRILVPAGKQVQLGAYPMGVLAHPNGKAVYVSNDGMAGRSVMVYAPDKGEIVQTVPRKDLYRFMALTKDGKQLYASGGPQSDLWRFDVQDDGTLGAVKAYDISKLGFYGVAPSPDGASIYGLVANAPLQNKGDGTAIELRRLDAETGALAWKVPVAASPYALALAPDGAHAYLTSWREGGVQRVDLASGVTPTKADLATFGKHAQGLAIAPDGGRIYASAVDSDRVAAIDTKTMTVLATASVGLSDEGPNGRDPGFMAVSPDGKRLYVVCAMSNEVVVFDAAALTKIGTIPVGWYPSGVDVSPDGQTLYVVNGKGTGLPPWDDSLSVMKAYVGTMSVVPLPSDATLAANVAVVQGASLGVSGLGRIEPTPDEAKVLPKSGPSPLIQHVVYLMRENKTFDVHLGDLGKPGVQAEPKWTLFGSEYTPNLHQLANEYCLLDNFYTDGDYSTQGHCYATAAKASDHIEKFYTLASSGKSVNPAFCVSSDSVPGNGFIFPNLIAHGRTTRAFGMAAGMGDDYLFLNVLDNEFPGLIFNTSVKDVVKADYFVTWLAANELPDFTFILLPNNHTCCGDMPEMPSPKSMIADNDEATGRVIEALSKSKYWDSTVIFIFEDDPQTGADSVYYHRSELVVVSPWVKKGHVVHTHHAMGSVHATMEHALDVSPLTELDAFATPIWECFSSEKQGGKYAHIPRLYPETLNRDEKKKKPMHKAWKRMRFDLPDQNPELGRVLWEMYTGKRAPWPDLHLEPDGDAD